MLEISIAEQELYNEVSGTFINIPRQTLRLEHSLVSISKWEAKWHKPFLSSIKNSSNEEIQDYVRCMTVTQNVSEFTYMYLSNDNFDAIVEYIDDPMTATTFSDRNNKPSREIITSEIIYYWMIAFNIPIECQKWHLNRLLALIKVCSIKEMSKGKKPGKMTASQIRARNEMNAKRRAALNSAG